MYVNKLKWWKVDLKYENKNMVQEICIYEEFLLKNVMHQSMAQTSSWLEQGLTVSQSVWPPIPFETLLLCVRPLFLTIIQPFYVSQCMVSKRTKAYAGLELGWAQRPTQPNKHLLRSKFKLQTWRIGFGSKHHYLLIWLL